MPLQLPCVASLAARRDRRGRNDRAGRAPVVCGCRRLRRDPASSVRGTTVDIGCGPGRLTQALMARGVTAMGIDVVPEAIDLTVAAGRRRLAARRLRPAAGRGSWGTALLADGNIGIGGDPVRLLAACGRAHLLTRSCRRRPRRARASDRDPSSVRSKWVRARTPRFRWATVPADQLELLAEAAALRVLGDGRGSGPVRRDPREGGRDVSAPKAPHVPRPERLPVPAAWPRGGRANRYSGSVSASAICFVTGLISHYAQDTPGWLTFPTRPVSMYRVTQGAACAEWHGRRPACCW